MSGFYRIGKPGEDGFVHLNTGRRSSGERCASPRFEADDPKWPICGRPSTALCDYPGCDKPMCEDHRTKDPSKPNTDYCPAHAASAASLFAESETK